MKFLEDIIQWHGNLIIDRDSYESTKDDFISSFKSNSRIEDYILSRVKDEEKALQYHSLLYGPSFNKGDLDMRNCLGQIDY